VEAVVIDYEAFAKIHQIARALGLKRKTLAKWLARPRFTPRQRCQPRSSILDPFKPRIIRLLDGHLYSARAKHRRLSTFPLCNIRASGLKPT
jgi:hypothetical protein